MSCALDFIKTENDNIFVFNVMNNSTDDNVMLYNNINVTGLLLLL